MSSRRCCFNNPNHFCYVCGRCTTQVQRRKITDVTKKAYFLYFKMKLGDQDKCWAPHIVCVSCNANLTQWLKGNGKMAFGIPMVWREQKDHTIYCYFLMSNIKGFSKKTRDQIKYPDVSSAIKTCCS